MTRYARSVQGTHRKPQEATPWSELRPAGKEAERKVDKKSKHLKKNHPPKTEGESAGADYRRGGKKKKKPQWKKTEWEMIETGRDETKGLAADLQQIDVDAKNPTLYRPKKISEKKEKSLSERLKSIQDEFGGEFSEEQKKEVVDLVKKDDRRENRRVKRQDERSNAKMCFNCRQPGHDMSECPKLKKDIQHGTGICFKCGSTEHAISTCPVRLPAGEFPYAKCFICGEQGHLSKQCPDNPRGLYPKGGCCRGCGSVEHYNKDCPEVLKQQGLEGVTVSRLTWDTNTEDDEGLREAKPTQVTKKKPKVVKF